MATGVVDRAEWAVVVQQLLDGEGAPLEPGGKPRIYGAKTRFAERVGLRTARTVDTWLKGDVDVREASVRQVAAGYSLNAMELLVRVGFYSVEQLPVRLTDEQIDEEQKVVLDLDLDDETKAMILRELESMRSTDQRLLDEQAQRDRQRRADRLQVLIEKARRRP